MGVEDAGHTLEDAMIMLLPSNARREKCNDFGRRYSLLPERKCRHRL